MQTRGAPLIGAIAAYGLGAGLRADASDGGRSTARTRCCPAEADCHEFQWALDEVSRGAQPPRGGATAAAYRRAAEICDEDVATNKAIGRHGLELIEKIARAKPGQPSMCSPTATPAGSRPSTGARRPAPIYMAHDAGIRFTSGSTKPGRAIRAPRSPRGSSASTACRTRSSPTMPAAISCSAGGSKSCIVGTDRTTAHGDVCNKIGTYLKALAAYDNGVPFYVALPSPSIDWTIARRAARNPDRAAPGDEVRMTGRTAAQSKRVHHRRPTGRRSRTTPST